MSKNPLNDFGKVSCSEIEQDQAINNPPARSAEKYLTGPLNVADEENSRAQAGQVNMAMSSDRPEGRDKVIAKDSNSTSERLPWWDDKAIEQEQDKSEMLQDRQPIFEIGQAIPDLHGFRGIDPANNRKYEKYEHRIIAELKAGGRTNQEICEITGYCASSVASIVKLPWVKQFVMDEIHKHGGQAVVDYMSQHAMPAAQTIVQGFMDVEMPRGRDRVAAANSVLDRLFGKANQNIVTHKGADLTKLTDDELANLAIAGNQ